MSKKDQQNITSTTTETFIKGLNKDSDATFIQEGMWAHARNAVNNTLEGDLGTLSNEASNALCAKVLNLAPVQPTDIKKIIGAIHLFADKWVIFSSVNSRVNPKESLYSEIGLFEEDSCNYRVIAEDKRCLNFSMYNLITGASRLQEDCSWGIYFADGNNPDRYLNIGDPKNWPKTNYLGNNYYEDNELWPTEQWEEKCFINTSSIDSECYESGQGCLDCTQLNRLDCDKIRLARIVQTPCLKVSVGQEGGSIPNGSYFVVAAYSIKQQRVTDWFSPSNIQPLWYEENSLGSLIIDVEADQINFDEFELCLVSIVNQQTTAVRLGFYNTSVNTIKIDIIDPRLSAIPISQLPIQNPVYETSEQILEVNNYLLRVAPTSKFDFNYQPLANLIQAKWQSVEYDADYYVNHGYKPSYLRDEVYAFYIRWIYNTGDKSASYHIPGRAAEDYSTLCLEGTVKECEVISNNQSHDVIRGEGEKAFEVFNTAELTAGSSANPLEVLDDGGVVLAEGKMAYWESSELYPADKPDVWNSSSQCWTGTTDSQYDLCGRPIRHHKFPEQSTGQEVHHFVNNNGDLKIRLLGVKFENIILPKDNDGNDIPGIVGYEILRGSRAGNKSIVAKGMLNNMRPYNIINNSNTGIIEKGLYPNYPFNTIKPQNPSNDTAQGTLNNANSANDPYIINVELEGGTGVFNPEKLRPVNVNLSDIPKNILSFHSPDTSFVTPRIAVGELKTYGYLLGQSEQEFVEPDKHPKHKLLNNGALIIMLAGAIVKMIVDNTGVREIKKPKVESGFGVGGDISATAGGTAMGALISVLENPLLPIKDIYDTATNPLTLLTTPGGVAAQAAFEGLAAAINTAALAGITNPMFNQQDDVVQVGGFTSNFPGVAGAAIRIGTALGRYSLSWAQGADDGLEILRTFTPFRQYALQMQAHGFYDEFKTFSCAQHRTRFIIDSALYLRINSRQKLKPDAGQNNYIVNNLLRQGSLVLNTKTLNNNTDGPDFIDTINPADADKSLITVGTSGADKDLWKKLQTDNGYKLNQTISSHYAAIKFRLRNQYGQINSVTQVPVSECEEKLDETQLQTVIVDCNGTDITQRILPETPVFFGGDTYINRYTEKNNMLFFNNWMYNLPNGTEFNYFLSQLVPQVRFWANTQKYDTGQLVEGFTTVSGIVNALQNLIANLPTATSSLTGSGSLPRSLYKLDNENYNYNFANSFNLLNPFRYPGAFSTKRSFFYLGVSSIRDFFVESDVIVDYRQARELPYEKHYNPYGFNDLFELLNINPDWITRGNSYFYDYSLSITKLFTQYFSQGVAQSNFYDPKVADQCFTQYPDRLVYSLPQQQESVKDGWFTYLANNYKNFQDEIIGVKNFAKTGIFIAFKNASPLILQGVDQLQTDLGTKITLGDGGLFANQPQNVTNADRPYEYGSCQNRLSIIATPVGMFYASQEQGKIFTYGEGLQEISARNMKWWFNNFLPYKLLEDFPEYPHTDNTVAGIGIHASYNNEDTVLYFSKRDFKLKLEYKDVLEYNLEEDVFIIPSLGNNTPIILLGDPEYFEDASWTVSYDPKNQYWVSFHDWHPNLFMPSKGNFYTTKEDGIYEHGKGCTSYCNFYGVDYPFEIEVPITTGQQVNTIRSLEYILECYRRSEFNCVDQFHVLDFNFDKAVIYNTEQVSGILELIPYPKNNPFAAQQYPLLTPLQNSYEVLFSKEENKYRINQFWDITRDRGEFTGTEENIWITEPNGYKKNLNPVNLDYQKLPQERKKFRHYANFLHLRRDVSDNTNMIVKILNTKKTYSPR
jgi:hypothetical protein